MQNLMVNFILFIFRLESPFWINLVEKSEIASLSRNLVPRLFVKFDGNDTFSVLDLFLQVLSKNSFGILMLPD